MNFLPPVRQRIKSFQYIKQLYMLFEVLQKQNIYNYCLNSGNIFDNLIITNYFPKENSKNFATWKNGWSKLKN